MRAGSFNASMSSAPSRGRDWALPLVLLLSVALQFTWLARVRLFGAHFDLPLLCVLSVGLLRGWRVGAVYGLASGLLCGVLAGGDVGTWGLSRLAIGALCGLFEEQMEADNPLAPSLCALGAVALSRAMFAIMAPNTLRFQSLSAVFEAFVGAWLLSALAAPFVHRWVMRAIMRPQRGMFGGPRRF